MQESEKYFLVVAKELNITRAASKLYITQQCLSEHIRKLEKKYDTQLFVRMPRLALTPAGEALVHALNEINVIEASFLNQIHNPGTNVVGSISFGVTLTRATILIPNLLPEYGKKYPNVSVSVISGSTEELELKLEEGKLDIFSGISNMTKNSLNYTLLEDERAYLCISDEILKAYVPHLLPELDRLKKEGVPLNLFQDIPFAINTPREHLRSFYAVMSMNFTHDPIIALELDDPFVRMQLSLKNYCATIIVGSMLRYMHDLNKTYKGISHLHSIPINIGFPYHYCNVVATNKRAFIPEYRQDFIHLIKKYYSAAQKNIIG